MPCRREPRFPSPHLILLLLWYRLTRCWGQAVHGWMDVLEAVLCYGWLAGTHSVTEVSSQSRSFRIRQVTNTPTGWRLSVRAGQPGLGTEMRRRADSQSGTLSLPVLA